MLIGMGRKKTDAAAGAGSGDRAGGFAFDVSVEDFEASVVAASMQKPVLVDFWAPWCGPCKQLMPVLEKAVSEAGGEVLLARVNIDENPELAQALRVQSVPTVYAFFQGQPVTAFAGARPASEIKTLIDQLLKMARQERPGAIDVPALLSEAAALLAEGRLAEAQERYIAVLGQEEANVQAYTGLVRTLIAAGELDQAKGMVEHAPDAIMADPAFAAARTALDLAMKRPDGAAMDRLAHAVAANPDDHQARFDLAEALFASGRADEAIDALVEIVRRNRTWEDEKARRQLLQFFDALGPADPHTGAGRRKLSAVLFS